MSTTRGDRASARNRPGRDDQRPRRAERYRDDAYHEDEAYDGEAYDEEPAAAADTGRVGLPASDAARAGLAYVADLTGKPTTGITSLERADSGWVVGVEVVEDRRIPSSGDILAVYRTELDADGDLRGYRRVRRYPRGRGDDQAGTG